MPASSLILLALGSRILGALGSRINSRDVELAPNKSPRMLKVRLFWVRHGLSCANVIDSKCAAGDSSDRNGLVAELASALKAMPGYSEASLNASFGHRGVRSRTARETCTVEVVGSELEAGRQGPGGAIVRVHDLYRDPALSDCARRQSLIAGRVFIGALRSRGIPIDFVGSSFLMRAFETAYGMFVRPCKLEAGQLCEGVLDDDVRVTPVPYMTERAPKGLTAMQADNTPRSFEEQARMLQELYGESLAVDSRFATTWPRLGQQWEKFKAFLAMVLVPSLSKSPEEMVRPDQQEFMAKLEEQLGEEMHHEHHGQEAISVEFDGGSYSTGAPLTKAEYDSIDAPELNLAVVGHNQMMWEYCLQHPAVSWRPNNNAVLEKLFLLEVPGQGDSPSTVLRELMDNCAMLMEGPSKSTSMASLVESDVASCTAPFAANHFIKSPPEQSPGEQSACVRASSPEAYPVRL
mmetsp:Transcript_106241/g.317430  ORF Transcript_106241/g.317430 Transcript_106241/m.317430 type:complete len:464 (+) Transcript_106241:81-1472(+)